MKQGIIFVVIPNLLMNCPINCCVLQCYATILNQFNWYNFLWISCHMISCLLCRKLTLFSDIKFELLLFSSNHFLSFDYYYVWQGIVVQWLFFVQLVRLLLKQGAWRENAQIYKFLLHSWCYQGNWEKRQLFYSLWWPIYVFNSVFNTKLPGWKTANQSNHTIQLINQSLYRIKASKTRELFPFKFVLHWWFSIQLCLVQSTLAACILCNWWYD